ncbi:hypothetical protein [Hymenobacter lapidarius]|uniref:hypothetical protein n=1 Tax=Hymenobacter lapidarius TaxID=1908237 RepID=UPI000F778237|nr:hypothetical protein [Hymenobacter lapidarius]
MKTNFSITKLAFIGLLALGASGILSCTKDLNVEPESKASPHTSEVVKTENLTLIQELYHSQKWQGRLTTNLQDTLALHRTPKWQAAYSKAQGDTIVYVYVPLEAAFKSKKTGINNKKTRLVGTRDFLIATTNGARTELHWASYIESANKKNTTPPAVGPNILFTGKLILRKAVVGRIQQVDYVNGIALPNRYKNKPGKTPSAGNREVCEDVWTCYWQTNNCRGGHDIVTSHGISGCDYPTQEYACSGWFQFSTTREQRCYDDGSDYPIFPPLPDPQDPQIPGGPTGGEPDPTSTVSVEQNADYLTQHDAALYGPCPYTTFSWGTQIQFKPPTSVIDKLTRLSYTPGVQLGPVAVDWLYYVQQISNAKGSLINLDYHQVLFSSLPITNGRQMTTGEFRDYLRLHLTDLSGTSFTPHDGTGENEANLWANSPVGSIIKIGIPGDRGSVITSDYYTSPDLSTWTFTTIHDPYVGDHPVSGTRKFGVEALGNGYIFFIQGTDRLTGNLDNALGYLTDIQGGGVNGLQFKASDQLWQKVIGNVKTLLNNQSISTTTVAPVMLRPDYDKIKAALDDGKPLSTVLCP